MDQQAGTDRNGKPLEHLVCSSNEQMRLGASGLTGGAKGIGAAKALHVGGEGTEGVAGDRDIFSDGVV